MNYKFQAHSKKINKLGHAFTKYGFYWFITNLLLMVQTKDTFWHASFNSKINYFNNNKFELLQITKHNLLVFIAFFLKFRVLEHDILLPFPYNIIIKKVFQKYRPSRYYMDRKKL